MNIWKINGIRFTTVKDYAEYQKISRPTVYALIEMGLPVIINEGDGIGAGYFVLIDEADKWLKKNRM